MYGTSKASVESIHNEEKLCILDVDARGIQQIKELAYPCRYVFIAPPSLSVLEERLRKRNTESEEQIQIRLSNARKEMEYGISSNFDAIIVNDQISESSAQLSSLLREWFPSILLISP